MSIIGGFNRKLN